MTALLPLLPLLANPAPPIDLSGVEGLVNAQDTVPLLLTDMKYSTTDNFVGKDLYGEFETCYLQKEAADMLGKAAASLHITHPELRLLAWDCLRPRRVQLMMWDVVKGTPQQSYVANPHSKTGSIHNYGCAIDLTLSNAKGEPLDMGTPFNHFGEAAHPRQEVTHRQQGKLSAEQLANRLLLREAMVRAGFIPLNNEWWHFNCLGAKETRTRYPLVE